MQDVTRPAMPGGGPFSAEFRAPAELHDVLEAWRALGARALEPALFAEPDLVRPALQHCDVARHVGLLMVWRQAATTRVLRGVFPMAPPRLALGLTPTALWQPGFDAVGAPLIDRDRPEDTIEAALTALRERSGPFGGLLMPRLVEDGPTARTLVATAARSGRRLQQSVPGRAIWLAAPDGPEPGLGRPRERSRRGAFQARRHSVIQARTAGDIRDAVERFLVIEAVAAKAEGRTAIVQDPGTASFMRSATRHFAHANRCRIETLRLDDAAVAAVITLETPDAVWLWASAALPGTPDARANLIRSTVAQARRRGKTVYLPDESLVTAPLAEELGLRRARLVDHRIAIGPGASVGALHLKQHLGRGMRGLAREGFRRLRGLTRPPPA